GELQFVRRRARSGAPLHEERDAGGDLAGRGDDRRQERRAGGRLRDDLQRALFGVERGAALSEERAHVPAHRSGGERDVVERGPGGRAGEHRRAGAPQDPHLGARGAGRRVPREVDRTGGDGVVERGDERRALVIGALRRRRVREARAQRLDGRAAVDLRDDEPFEVAGGHGGEERSRRGAGGADERRRGVVEAEPDLVAEGVRDARPRELHVAVRQRRAVRGREQDRPRAVAALARGNREAEVHRLGRGATGVRRLDPPDRFADGQYEVERRRGGGAGDRGGRAVGRGPDAILVRVRGREPLQRHGGGVDRGVVRRRGRSRRTAVRAGIGRLLHARGRARGVVARDRIGEVRGDGGVVGDRAALLRRGRGDGDGRAQARAEEAGAEDLRGGGVAAPRTAGDARDGDARGQRVGHRGGRAERAIVRHDDGVRQRRAGLHARGRALGDREVRLLRRRGADEDRRRAGGRTAAERHGDAEIDAAGAAGAEGDAVRAGAGGDGAVGDRPGVRRAGLGRNARVVAARERVDGD